MTTLRKESISWFLNFGIALIVLSFASFIWERIEYEYIKYADLSNFYENIEFTASDICVGDREHVVSSRRIVKGTDLGYQATVVRELIRVSSPPAKIFEETVHPFVEKAEDGSVERIQQLPKLEVGTYKWILYIELDINGVLKKVVPPVESNEFRVESC